MQTAKTPGFDRLLRMRSTWMTPPREGLWQRLPAGCWSCTLIGMLLGGLAVTAGFVLAKSLVQ